MALLAAPPVWGQETLLPPALWPGSPQEPGLLLASRVSAHPSRFTAPSLLSAWDSFLVLHSQLVNILVWG